MTYDEDIRSGWRSDLRMGQDQYADRYLSAVDAGYGRGHNGSQEDDYIASQQVVNVEYDEPVVWKAPREAALKRDTSDPFYQDVGRQIGIERVGTAQDMGRVMEYLSRPRTAPAAAAPAPAAAPAAAARPTPAPFNLGDYTAPAKTGEGESRTAGFMRTFIEDLSKRQDQSGSAANTTPTLYEKFAADYEKGRKQRAESFAAPRTADGQEEEPALTADAARPFADDASFRSAAGRGYEQLNRTYDELAGRRRTA
jgi:hypothetical protein